MLLTRGVEQSIKHFETQMRTQVHTILVPKFHGMPTEKHLFLLVNDRSLNFQMLASVKDGTSTNQCNWNCSHQLGIVIQAQPVYCCMNAIILCG